MEKQDTLQNNNAIANYASSDHAAFKNLHSIHHNTLNDLDSVSYLYIVPNNGLLVNLYFVP